MKPILYILSPFILAGLAYWYYANVMGGQFRMTASDPLGGKARLEEYLKNSNFEKVLLEEEEEEDEEMTEQTGEECKKIRWIDSDAKKGGWGGGEHVTLTVNPAGKVLKVQTVFALSMGSGDVLPYKRARYFAVHHWINGGGSSDPNFKDVPELGADGFYHKVEVSEFQTTRLKGRWLRYQQHMSQTVIMEAK